MLCLLLGRICLQTSNDPSTNRSQSQTVLPIPRRILSPKHIFFNTIKPLLVLKSSPSRTNTNFNTLQCSFPKTPLNTAFISPIPQNPSIPPNLLSHNRKSFGASAMAPARLRSLVGRAQRPFSLQISELDLPFPTHCDPYPQDSKCEFSYVFLGNGY